jgi:transposase
MSRVAAMVREHGTRVWPVVEHHVHTARAGADFSDVRRVGMDETSPPQRGRTTSPLFADLDAGRVCFATEGRDAGTVSEFAADLSAHGGDPKQVRTTSSDMSAAFIRGIRDALPNAQLTFGRYHLAAKLSEAARCRAPRRARHPARAHTHPLAVAEELAEPVGDPTRRAATAAAALSPARHRAGPALA